jgi:hypothetical protein
MRSDTVLNEFVAGPRPIITDRRQRTRLRDLCDEVLASFRLASGRDPISEQDRRAAMELMPGITGRVMQ